MRRLWIVLALVLAGCGSAVATPKPPTAAPTPAPTATAVPTLEPTADPCADSASTGASLELHGIDGLLSLELDAGDPGPGATISPTVIEATDTALGGPTDVVLQLGLDDTDDASIELISLTADFVPFEATMAEPVSVAIDGRTARLELPGRDVTGVLRVAAAWTSPCGEGNGGGRLGLKLIDPRLSAGCPPTSEGLREQVEALQATTLRLGGPGGVQLPIGIVGWSGRWTDAAAIDEVPQFAGWDTAIVVSVPAGATMNVKDVLDGTDFTQLRFAFYERSEVVAWLDGSRDELTPVDIIRKNPSATGGVEVPLDFAPGRYVVEIQGAWQTPCLDLDTYVVVSVDRA